MVLPTCANSKHAGPRATGHVPRQFRASSASAAPGQARVTEAEARHSVSRWPRRRVRQPSPSPSGNSGIRQAARSVVEQSSHAAAPRSEHRRCWKRRQAVTKRRVTYARADVKARLGARPTLRPVSEPPPAGAETPRTRQLHGHAALPLTGSARSEFAQIQACAARARHDCFCSRARLGRAIAKATKRKRRSPGDVARDGVGAA